ncbi:hypothetical protein CV093_17760 [Oceanobacillus sp. 143]|nr:hypothetical protein CV093_17760 [Oceanobacillus sp. 143]
MVNELRRAVKEKDPLERGEKIARLFDNFMVQCVQGSGELEQLINSNLINEEDI